MSACPSRDLLQGLLNECLEGPELAEIVIHIEVCARCQEQLATLTLGHGWKSTVPDFSSKRGSAGEPAAQASVPAEGDPAGDAIGVAEIRVAIDEPDPAGGSTDQLTTEVPTADPDRTVNQSGSQNGSRRSQPVRSSIDWPRVPGYEILDRLGEGGMGVVYKARQVGLNRLVALKMIRGGSQARPDILARFPIEAEAVARLRHSNILHIYDIGEVDHLPFVSLELLEGGSLAARLASTPQPGRPSAELLVMLAHAIHAAHQAGIVHRDLKPSNVLFTTDGVPKITDFGLAKRLESDDKHTITGQIIGSPSYMAPEQARGQTRDVGPAADIYALGAILYETLTGRPPFKGETPIETVRQVSDDDPVQPSRLVPRVSRDLETICLKCLNKEPRKRYESAQALADDLERHLRGEPIKARRTPLWERGAKWARRHQVATMLLGLGTVGILGSCAGILEYQRTRASGLQHESDRTLALLTEGTNAILAARNAMEQHELTEAMATLTRLQGKLAGESASNLRQLNSMAGSLLKEIDKRLAEERSRDRDVYHRGIMAFLHLKQYDEVIRACDTLLARDKRSAALYERRALARTGLTDFPGAIQDYSQAIALEPGRASVLVRRGWLYLASDAAKQALRDFEEAVRLDPRDSDALSGRGAALVRLGQHREAVAVAESALRLDAPSSRGLYNAARIYASAAAVAAAEVRKQGQDAVRLVERYQDRAATLLRKAFNELPAGQRAAFWRDVVGPDPAMKSLRHHLRFEELAGERMKDEQ